MNNLSNIRPNTADVDYKMTFRRGHRIFNKGMKILGPVTKNEEKKENFYEGKIPLKRAGTSNLLFRKTSKKKVEEFNNNADFSNAKGFQMNLFEKYQTFLVIL